MKIKKKEGKEGNEKAREKESNDDELRVDDEQAPNQSASGNKSSISVHHKIRIRTCASVHPSIFLILRCLALACGTIHAQIYKSMHIYYYNPTITGVRSSPDKSDSGGNPVATKASLARDSNLGLVTSY
jgi:hypothetical protein